MVLSQIAKKKHITSDNLILSGDMFNSNQNIQFKISRCDCLSLYRHTAYKPANDVNGILT